MNLTQAEYFLAVADKLNFTAAAKSLYISQPALSKQIALLEEELGTQLLVRNNKKVILTKAGEQFQKDLAQIIKQMDEAKEHVREIGREDKKILRIGCFDGASTDDFLPDLYARIREIAPETELDIRRGNFVSIRRDLAEGKADIILTLDFELADLHGYHSMEIVKRKGCFVYSEKSPLAKTDHPAIHEFNGQTFLVTNPEISSGGFHAAMELVRELGIRPGRVEKMDDMINLLTYLELGYGFALLDGAVADKRKGLQKREIDSPVNSMSVIAVWKYDTPLISEMLKIFR